MGEEVTSRTISDADVLAPLEYNAQSRTVLETLLPSLLQRADHSGALPLRD